MVVCVEIAYFLWQTKCSSGNTYMQQDTVVGLGSNPLLGARKAKKTSKNMN